MVPQNQRIENDKIHIDDKQVWQFFENRTNKKLPNIINYTNYQDKHPEIAIERDKYEHHKILPFLGVQPNSRVLDVGCGVGRWGRHLLPILSGGGCYTGVDYSGNLLSLANQNLCVFGGDNYRLYKGCFQEIQHILPESEKAIGYDVILVNGVLMYINDEDLPECMNNLRLLLKQGGRLYLKESVGINNRLTLNKLYSEELDSSYSAIYRTIAEYDALIKACLLQNGLRIMHEDAMWPNELANRKETTAYFWIIERYC